MGTTAPHSAAITSNSLWRIRDSSLRVRPAKASAAISAWLSEEGGSFIPSSAKEISSSDIPRAPAAGSCSAHVRAIGSTRQAEDDQLACSGWKYPIAKKAARVEDERSKMGRAVREPLDDLGDLPPFSQLGKHSRDFSSRVSWSATWPGHVGQTSLPFRLESSVSRRYAQFVLESSVWRSPFHRGTAQLLRAE